ncbi:hypothetical protein BCD67_18785 [Oscillatoriales cyanobacterium USR001]|nr:hypothetical protein BCD67_18785 [Oscillatoriales cyanobacterium USR001]
MSRPYPARLSAKLFKSTCTTILAPLLALTFGCSPNYPPNTLATSSSTKIPIKTQSPNSILTQNLNKTKKFVAANSCSQNDPFYEAVNFANKAANLTQTAKSKAEWDEVAGYWVQAVAWMQAVSPNSPKRAFAEKKVIEYMRYLNYAQQQATTVRSQVNSASFSSDILDRQLQLYLSYIAAVGPPDILIVGSSRALQGVDPRQLQQSLAAIGYGGLTVFNFGVNGATAQVVEFQLRKLLTPQQLPQMIIWADGVRAFNDGRIDRTFNAIATSEGNKMLANGIRPQLSENEPKNPRICYRFPRFCQANFPDRHLVNISVETKHSDLKSLLINNKLITNNLSAGMLPAQNLLPELENTIDAHGFLGLSNRYNPDTYYQNRPLVSGSYDGDYNNFNLGGRQIKSLISIANFAKIRKIPLIFVNLPLTEDYLDSVRSISEEKFRQRMQILAQQNGFIFRDLSQLWPTRNDYFVDPSHLNRYGAIAVSEELVIDWDIPWPMPRQKGGESTFHNS